MDEKQIRPGSLRPSRRSGKAAIGRESNGVGFFVVSLLRFFFGSPWPIGFTSLAVTHVMWLLGWVRFMFPNVLVEPPTKFKVGFPEEYAAGTGRDEVQGPVWHLDCAAPVRGAIADLCLEGRLHASRLHAELAGEPSRDSSVPATAAGFTRTGSISRVPHRVRSNDSRSVMAEDGQLEVDKSRTFQEELGQWDDPECLSTCNGHVASIDRHRC